MRNAECGLKKISIAASQPAVPGGGFGINIPHSAFRNRKILDPLKDGSRENGTNQKT
jgi:hypothetical protein